MRGFTGLQSCFASRGERSGECQGDPHPSFATALRAERRYPRVEGEGGQEPRRGWGKILPEMQPELPPPGGEGWGGGLRARCQFAICDSTPWVGGLDGEVVLWATDGPTPSFPPLKGEAGERAQACYQNGRGKHSSSTGWAIADGLERAAHPLPTAPVKGEEPHPVSGESLSKASAHLPPPLRGRVGVGGGSVIHRWTPTLYPSPQGGGRRENGK